MLGPSEYAARIHDFRTYGAVSRDMIRRWIYPVVPDNLPSGYERLYNYSYARNFIYKETRGNTIVDRSAKVNDGCILGANASVGGLCVLSSTVVGHNVTIGENARITDSHLWDGVRVGSMVAIDQSILCEGVEVMDGATIGKGCVIGKGCKIGKGVVVPMFTRVMHPDHKINSDDDGGNDWSDSEESEEEEGEGDKAGDGGGVSDPNVVGVDGVGKMYSVEEEGEDDSDDSDEEDKAEYEIFLSQDAQSIGFDGKAAFQTRVKLQTNGGMGFEGGGGGFG